MNYKKEKNYFLFFLEGFACINVIFIHCMFPSWLGVLVCGLARFAVPLFFIVSGYYLVPDNMNRKQRTERFRKKCINTGYILALAFLFYLLWRFVYLLLTSGLEAALQYIYIYLQPRHILSMLLLNDYTAFGGHLWYLGAVLYCYLIFLATDTERMESIARWMIPLLLGIHLLGRIMCGFFGVESIFDIPVYILFRNWLFMAFPFVLTGYVIQKKQDMILQHTTAKRLFFLFLTGVLFTCAENVFVYLKTGEDRELYVGTLLMTISMFLFALQNFRKPTISWVETIGERHLLFIYIIHLAVIEATNIILSVCGVNHFTMIHYIKPLLIVLITVEGAKIWDFFVCQKQNVIKHRGDKQ